MVDEFDHEHLTASKEYIVIGFDDEYLRVVDDHGNPTLYPRALFDVIDAFVPTDWVARSDPDGLRYVDPPECAAPGFYEDVADGRPHAIAVFQELLQRLGSLPNPRVAPDGPSSVGSNEPSSGGRG
ncbi:MAG: hypothetical protein IPG04_40010 [Polyangiaceae bacterium]|nr:hypothetical protein [Polyangiaceae bacterium]